MANETRRRWRTRSRQALERYFERHSFPRLMLSLILCVTGVAGFSISYELLHLGVQSMWIRYPVATLGAYVFCLGLLRIWAEFERSRFRPEHLDAGEGSRSRTLQEQGEYSTRWTEWLEFDDVDFSGDADGCFLGVLLAAVLAGVAWVFLSLISGASLLMAEVFLDAFFVSALYRRLKVAGVEHWLGTALRRTWWHVLTLALLLGLLGYVLERLVPGSSSIGPAIEHLLHSSE